MLLCLGFQEEKEGETDRFLTSYYQKEYHPGITQKKNTYIVADPMEIHDLIVLFMDNSENYDSSLWIKLPECDIIKINEKNFYRILCDVLNLAT
jgi:hypothetical protein